MTCRRSVGGGGSVESTQSKAFRYKDGLGAGKACALVRTVTYDEGELRWTCVTVTRLLCCISVINCKVVSIRIVPILLFFVVIKK